MKYTFVLIAIATISLSSCGTFRTIYTASPPCNPIFQEKGDSKLAAYFSSNDPAIDSEAGSKANGIDVQAAYAFSKKFAATFTYLQRNEIDKNIYNGLQISSFRTDLLYNRKMVEVGGGYFSPIDNNNNFMFNIYVGVGFGKFSFDDVNTKLNYSRYYSNDITKAFIMPSINLKVGQYFWFSSALKYSYVHYGNQQTSYTLDESKQLTLDKLSSRAFLEPAFTIQFGLPKYPWVKLELIASAAFSVSKNQELNLVTRQGNQSIGLVFDVFKMKNAKK